MFAFLSTLECMFDCWHVSACRSVYTELTQCQSQALLTVSHPDNPKTGTGLPPHALVPLYRVRSTEQGKVFHVWRYFKVLL